MPQEPFRTCYDTFALLLWSIIKTALRRPIFYFAGPSPWQLRPRFLFTSGERAPTPKFTQINTEAC